MACPSHVLAEFHQDGAIQPQTRQTVSRMRKILNGLPLVKHVLYNNPSK
jgi:hypothetical protein